MSTSCPKDKAAVSLFTSEAYLCFSWCGAHQQLLFALDPHISFTYLLCFLRSAVTCWPHLGCLVTCHSPDLKTPWSHGPLTHWGGFSAPAAFFKFRLGDCLSLLRIQVLLPWLDAFWNWVLVPTFLHTQSNSLPKFSSALRVYKSMSWHTWIEATTIKKWRIVSRRTTKLIQNVSRTFF